MTPRQKLKTLTLLLLLAQPLHWAFIWAIEEPYPALALPGFSYAGPRQDEPLAFQSVTLTVHFQNAPPQEITPRQLLANSPISHYPAILSDNFGPQRLLPQASTQLERKKSPLTLFFRSILPGYRLRQANRSAPIPTAWLRTRIHQLYPDRSPTSITLRWHTHRFSPTNPSAPPTIEPLQETTLSLEQHD